MLQPGHQPLHLDGEDFLATGLGLGGGTGRDEGMLLDVAVEFLPEIGPGRVSDPDAGIQLGIGGGPRPVRGDIVEGTLLLPEGRQFLDVEVGDDHRGLRPETRGLGHQGAVLKDHRGAGEDKVLRGFPVIA